MTHICEVDDGTIQSFHSDFETIKKFLEKLIIPDDHLEEYNKIKESLQSNIEICQEIEEEPLLK